MFDMHIDPEYCRPDHRHCAGCHPERTGGLMRKIKEGALIDETWG